MDKPIVFTNQRVMGMSGEIFEIDIGKSNSSSFHLCQSILRLVDGKYPEVSLNGTWSPICGHYFWNNNHGATLFCQKLNPEFKSGTLIRRHDKPLESDGIKIGGCFSDDHWPECTGGCNDFETGSSCFEANGGKCTAGEVSSMEIHCSIGKYQNMHISTVSPHSICICSKNLLHYLKLHIIQMVISKSMVSLKESNCFAI